MKIYLYNINNKNEYLESMEVIDSSIYSGCSTEIPYPQTDLGYVRCFDNINNNWGDPIIDYRGSLVYYKTSSYIKKVYRDIGPIRNDWTLITPPDEIKNYKYSDELNQWIIEEPEEVKEPKKYSKLLIVRKLKEFNLWTDIKQLIIDSDAWDEWEAATYLSEDDPLFLQLINILKNSYPDLDIENELNNCIY